MWKFIIATFVLSLVVLGIVISANPDLISFVNNRDVSTKDSREIASPLPELLSGVLGTTSRNDIYWRPNISEVVESSVARPDLAVVSAISYDLTEDKLLFARDIKRRLPIASLTKIMTAIIALENGSLDQEYTVSDHAATIGENTMGLTQGEKLTLEELLYGLVLHSGNDAAEVIAEGSKYGRENFVYMMNKKAEDLGLTDTHFTNPSGLEGDGYQYGSAYDLLVLTRYALQNPTFAKVVATVTYELPFTSKHKYLYLFNETNLLTSYPGVKGVKTGYTTEAGLCLVTYLNYNGHEIIAVLLNAQNRRQEMKDLLDYSLRSVGVKPPPHS